MLNLWPESFVSEALCLRIKDFLNLLLPIVLLFSVIHADKAAMLCLHFL